MLLTAYLIILSVTQIVLTSAGSKCESDKSNHVFDFIRQRVEKKRANEYEYMNEDYNFENDQIEEYKTEIKCPEIQESKTTIRVSERSSSDSKIGAVASFSCRNAENVMLGDKDRECMEEGKWSGAQPVCMSTYLAKYYCDNARDGNRCKHSSKTLSDSLYARENSNKCPLPAESKTTIRINLESDNDEDAKMLVSYACKDDWNVMLGDATRKCVSNRWTGTQPFCLPAELVKYYCGYARDDGRCKVNAPKTETLRGEQSESRNCRDLVDSLTTLRLTDNPEEHGHEVHYACKTDTNVMLGSDHRKCQSNGQWSGIQPFCMPPELVEKYCGYATEDKRCSNIYSSNRLKERSKRRTLSFTKHPEYSFETNEMNATSDIICIGFSFIFQENSKIEVLLKQSDSWFPIWKGKTTDYETMNDVQFETLIDRGKSFKLKVIGKHENENFLQFFLKHFYIYSGTCDSK